MQIEEPAVLKGLPLTSAGYAGVRGTPCATCHEGRQDKAFPDSAGALEGPHAGLVVKHGDLACASCHEASARDRLHLASGESVPLAQAMALCSQCHGPQRRAYNHGAHGGMRGYWDLSRGPRQRNHCASCHDPHAPAFGSFMPVEGPKDRFTASEGAHHD